MKLLVAPLDRTQQKLSDTDDVHPPIKPLRVLLHRFADTPRGGYGKDMAAVDLHCISEVALMEI